MEKRPLKISLSLDTAVRHLFYLKETAASNSKQRRSDPPAGIFSFKEGEVASSWEAGR
jgi:hypothetical protein